MQTSLFLFLLVGPSFILARELYEYHFIKENKSWHEAQQHCKLYHTDLAVLSDARDARRLLHSQNFEGEAWIGLRSEGGVHTQSRWMWADGSSFMFRNWDSPQTSENQQDQQCALIVSTNGGKWKNDKCDARKPFFCYHDNVVLIQANKSWEDALNHCRENNQDLVTITSPTEQLWVQEKASKASTTHVWMGLKYSCFLDLWFWVSDTGISYENWGHNGRGECDISGAMEKGQYMWDSQNENVKFNFICISK